MDEPDHELWRHVRAGDADAFVALFDRYGTAIRGYCFRLTADHALADDLVSVVFLEAWRRRSEVVPVSVRGWLYGVATNVMRNQRRSLRRYRAALDRLPPVEPEPDFADAVAARLDVERRMRQILVEVAALPEGEREVFALCLWQGLTGSEAAQALAISEATVRTRLHRARARLAGADTGGCGQPRRVAADAEEVR